MPRALLRRFQYLFWCGGVLFCCLAIWKYVDMRHSQATENRRLEEALRAKVPAPPLPPVLRKPGSLVGRIEIPRLNLSAIVLEGSDSRVLSLGVGRIPQTSVPGEAGNVVLGGHRDTFFRPLKGIRKGDSIRIQTPQGLYKYTVDWMQVVDPENTGLLKATPQPSLTLVTCYPFYYVGAAPRRFIVRAHQETEAAKTADAADHDRHLGTAPMRQARRAAARGPANYVTTGGRLARGVRRSHERSQAARARPVSYRSRAPVRPR